MNSQHQLEQQFQKAWQHRVAGEQSAAIKLIEAGQAAAQEIESRLWQAKFLTLRGQLHRDQGELEDAIRVYEQALPLLQDDESKSTLAHTLRHVGNIAMELGRLPKAKKNFLLMQQIYRELPPNDLEWANANRVMGLLHEQLNEIPKAIECWQIAAKTYDALGIDEGAQEGNKKIRCLSKLA